MAKATIKFDLEDSDDRYAYNRCNKSSDMANMLFHLRYNFARSIHNITDEQRDENFSKGADMVLEKVSELFEEYGINLDDLTR